MGGITSPRRASTKGPYGIRTRAAAVRGRCPRPLDEWAEQNGAECSRRRPLHADLGQQRGRVERVEADPRGDLLARRLRALAEQRRAAGRRSAGCATSPRRRCRSGGGAAGRSGSRRAGSRPSRSRVHVVQVRVAAVADARRLGEVLLVARRTCRRRRRSATRSRARSGASPRSGGRAAPRGTRSPRRSRAASASERPK